MNLCISVRTVFFVFNNDVDGTRVKGWNADDADMADGGG